MRLSKALVLGCAISTAPLSAQSPSEAKKCAAQAPAANAWEQIEQNIRNNYAYLTDLPDHDAVLSKARDRAAQAKTNSQLAAIVHDIGYAYADGHFDARAGGPPYRNLLNSGTDMWVDLQSDGQFRIVDVKSHSDAYSQGIVPGDYVTHVSGVPLLTAVEDLLDDITDNPTAEQREFAANVVIAGKNGAARELTIQNAQGVRSYNLVDGLSSAKRGRPADGTPLSVVDYGEAALVRFHNRLGWNGAISVFDDAMTRLAEKKAIILDFRDTPGGGNTTVARGIMGHFVSEVRPYQVHENTWEEVIFGVRRRYAEMVAPRGDKFSGKVVVLGGRWTGSVAEALVIGLDGAANAHAIGTEMAKLHGTYNNSGGCIRIGFAYDKLFHVNGTPREDFLPPDLLQTGEATDGGIDPALERTRRWLAAHSIRMMQQR